MSDDTTVKGLGFTIGTELGRARLPRIVIPDLDGEPLLELGADEDGRLDVRVPDESRLTEAALKLVQGMLGLQGCRIVAPGQQLMVVWDQGNGRFSVSGTVENTCTAVHSDGKQSPQIGLGPDVKLLTA